jgi:hypothetical protein
MKQQNVFVTVLLCALVMGAHVVTAVSMSGSRMELKRMPRTQAQFRRFADLLRSHRLSFPTAERFSPIDGAAVPVERMWNGMYSDCVCVCVCMCVFVFTHTTSV